MRNEFNRYPLELIRGQIHTLQYAGFALDSLRALNLPQQAFQAQELDSSITISVAKAGLVMRATKILFNNTDIDSNLGLAHTHLLFMSALHSKTLGDMLKTQYEQASSLGNSYGFSIETDEQHYLCGFSRSSFPSDTPFNLLQRSEIGQLFWWYRVACWFVSELIPLQRVTIMGADTHVRELTERLFQCPVDFNAESYGIVFPNEQLSLPVTRNRDELELLINDIGRACVDITPPATRSSIDIVKAMLNKEPHIQMEIVAERLHCSRHTVIRRLKEEGTSFQTLKTTTRMDKARELLILEGRSIETISNQLGFANPPAFTRAFKARFEVSPSHFREQYRN